MGFPRPQHLASPVGLRISEVIIVSAPQTAIAAEGDGSYNCHRSGVIVDAGQALYQLVGTTRFYAIYKLSHRTFCSIHPIPTRKQLDGLANMLLVDEATRQVLVEHTGDQCLIGDTLLVGALP